MTGRKSEDTTLMHYLVASAYRLAIYCVLDSSGFANAKKQLVPRNLCSCCFSCIFRGRYKKYNTGNNFYEDDVLFYENTLEIYESFTFFLRYNK